MPSFFFYDGEPLFPDAGLAQDQYGAVGLGKAVGGVHERLDGRAAGDEVPQARLLVEPLRAKPLLQLFLAALNQRLESLFQGLVRDPVVDHGQASRGNPWIFREMTGGNGTPDLPERIRSGEFTLPRGVSYKFAGSYENQRRAAAKLALILPFALFVIFMLIYFQFKSVPTTLLVFSGIFVAWAGGFLLVWAYGQPWFLDFSLFGIEMRSLFQIHTINMSVAVWVGFLALFGIASPHFLTTDNLLNVMQQSAINAILGIGLTFVIVSGGIDLSVGSLVALTGVA